MAKGRKYGTMGLGENPMSKDQLTHQSRGVKLVFWQRQSTFWLFKSICSCRRKEWSILKIGVVWRALASRMLDWGGGSSSCFIICSCVA